MKVKKLPSGNWHALVYIGKDQDGKRKYDSVTAPTKREAEFLAAKRKLDRPNKSTMTLRTAGEQYMKIRSESLSPTTKRLYAGILRNNLKGIMNTPICELSQDRIQAAVNEEAITHSPKTVRNYSFFVSAVLKMYRPDFVYKVTLPKKIKKKVYIPDKAAVESIGQQIKGKKIELPFLLASRLGLRASEIAGLVYKNVDKTKKTVTVDRAMVRGIDGQTVKAPKSYAGYRTLPCPDDILDMIGEGKPDESVTKMTQTDITNAWSYIMRHTDGEKFSFHKLRHYFASRAMLAGVPQKYIMEMMGHATSDMLNQVYEHTFPDESEAFKKMVISL